jgi:hypothetical protein
MAGAADTLVFSEACYGAHLEGRAVADSVALSSLAAGALGFVGATGVAYGGLDGPLVAADLLAAKFWQEVRRGASAGTALARAKMGLAEQALAHRGYVDAVAEKASLKFVLYGDPSLAHHAPRVWAEDVVAMGQQGSVGRAGSAAMVGTSPTRPHTLPDGAAPGEPVCAPAGLEDEVRRAVARRLPEFAAGAVAVTTGAPAPEPGPKALDPGQRGRARRLVVTLSKAVPTGSGPSCPSVVRVTVEATGTIRRLAVSR